MIQSMQCTVHICTKVRILNSLRNILLSLSGSCLFLLPFFYSTESHENPFGETGELSKKADYIVRNSTISRTEIRIADPDATPEPDEACEEPMLSASAAPVSAASPKNAAGDSLAGAKENGKVDEPLSPQNVEVKVADASLPPEGEAEAVKVPKDKKCKCCVLQ